MALKGFLNKGDHVVITSTEHNSVSRPLKAMARDGIISLDIAPCDRYGYVIIDEFKNDKLKEFVKDIWVKNKDLIKISPAAKMMHHNYLGGLIQHIYECLEFAQCIYPNMYKKINKDILFAACILHDIGKIFEYKINFETGFVDYNEDFRKDWISHSQYGFTLCMSNDQPQIAKMIASHHGRADWGAMIDLGEKDLENYYYIVHHIDDLSAKFGRIYVSDL